MVGAEPALDPNDIGSPDPYALRERHWPLLRRDPALAETAAVMVGELVRFLNHATRPSAPTTLPYASTAYRVVGSLATAAHSLEQLHQQLAVRAYELAHDPTLRHDQYRDVADSQRHAAAAAWKASKRLAEASGAADLVAMSLHRAQNELAPLSHDLDAEHPDEQ